MLTPWRISQVASAVVPEMCCNLLADVGATLGLKLKFTLENVQSVFTRFLVFL